MNGEIDKTLAEEAIRIVTGDRPGKYGPPEENFRNIALTWQGVLRAHHGATMRVEDLDARDVSLMMVAMKLCRESFSHQRDNFTDAIGYILTADRVTFDTVSTGFSGIGGSASHTSTAVSGYEQCSDEQCNFHHWIVRTPHVHEYRSERDVKENTDKYCHGGVGCSCERIGCWSER